MPRAEERKFVREAGVERFVAVRFFLPGTSPTVEVYDRESASDVKAWDETQKLYRSQVVGFAAEPGILTGGTDAARS